MHSWNVDHLFSHVHKGYQILVKGNLDINLTDPQLWICRIFVHTFLAMSLPWFRLTYHIIWYWFFDDIKISKACRLMLSVCQWQIYGSNTSLIWSKYFKKTRYWLLIFCYTQWVLKHPARIVHISLLKQNTYQISTRKLVLKWYNTNKM